MKNHLRFLTQEERNAVEDILDPYAFERYCGSCFFFPNHSLSEKGDNPNAAECPFKEKFLSGEYNESTDWKQIKCKKFYD